MYSCVLCNNTQFHWRYHLKCVVHTFVSAAEKVLVDLLHPLQVDAADLRVVDHGLGVVDSYDAFRLLLCFLWGLPGVVDVFGRVVF